MTKTVTSYFCTGNQPSKSVDISNCSISEYKGFEIAQGASSYLLIMSGVVINETVGKRGATELADRIIDEGRAFDDPKSIALDYEWKLVK